MPLQKLWKSIFGGTEERESTCASGSQETSQSPSFHSPVPTDTAKPVASNKRNSLQRADKKLLQRVGSMEIQSVLQVGVTDSSRSLSILSALAGIATESRLRFVAIDQFEMGGNTITLRAFHKQLRGVEAAAQLIPMPVDAGLERVLSTTGQVDLILWNTTDVAVQQHLGVLTRLCKPDTLLFIEESGAWSETRCSLLSGGTKDAA